MIATLFFCFVKMTAFLTELQHPRKTKVHFSTILLIVFFFKIVLSLDWWVDTWYLVWQSYQEPKSCKRFNSWNWSPKKAHQLQTISSIQIQETFIIDTIWWILKRKILLIIKYLNIWKKCLLFLKLKNDWLSECSSNFVLKILRMLTKTVGYFCVLKYFRSLSISLTFFVQNFSAKNQKAERN